MVASDRISAFDVVLPTPIPNKGRVLNQISAFWFDKHKNQMRNHLIEVVTQEWLDSLNSIDSSVKSELAPFVNRAMIVEKAERIDVECIVRGYLTGSAWAEYKKSGTVWGQKLPEGLVDGQVLPEPLFTPTTKAEEGHDQQMSRDQVVEMVGESLASQLEEKSLALYSSAHDYARQKGIILADTKMEFGLLDGELILIDELLTPDSSRFWDAEGYQPGRSLPNFDKQYVRDWLDAQGWDHEPPAPSLPEDVVNKTSQRYMEAYHRLTGEELSHS
jgi:phosphoribosylaminoimidazole-succinocarboxamide synthase